MKALIKLSIIWLVIGSIIPSVIFGDTIDEEVLVLFQAGIITMPKGKISATLIEIGAPPEVLSVLQELAVQEISKDFPDFESADTLRISPHGWIARLPDFSNLYILLLPADADRDSAVLKLETLSDVIYAEKNQRGYPEYIPNDPRRGNQWYLGENYIGAYRAFDFSQGSGSTKIGIIDDGVDCGHEDLRGKVLGDIVYTGGHGTHVAGIVAAKTNNDTGIVGLDWHAKIWAETVGDFSIPKLADAVISATNSGCRILNNSWGIDEFSQTLYSAFTYAYQMGALPVSSMSNTTAPHPYPKKFGHWMMNVGATNQQNRKAWFSVPGYWIDVGAPGEGIYSTYPNNLYRELSGTSMAAPVVSGIAGLLLGANPNLYNYDLEWIIKLTATDRPPTGFDESTGYGRINADTAVMKAISPYQILRGTPTISRISQNAHIAFLNRPRPEMAIGSYICDIYKVEVSRNHLFEEAPWGWFSLTGYSLANPNYTQEYLYRDATTNSVTLRTYFYWIKTDLGMTPINKWAPVDTNLIPLKYAILGRGLGTAQPDNQVKNWWWPPEGYVGNGIYNNNGNYQNVTQLVDSNQTAIFHIKIENDGTVSDNINVKAETTWSPGNWAVRFFDALTGGNNITTQIMSPSGWLTGILSPGQYREIRAEVTAGSRITKRVKITSRSYYDMNKIDVIWMDTYIYIFQPDLLIRNRSGYDTTYIGNNIYNNIAVQTKEQTVWRQTAVYDIKIEHDGDRTNYPADGIYIRGAGSDANWNIRYFYGTQEITQWVISAEGYLMIVPYNSPKYIRTEVTPISVPHNGVKECSIIAVSGYNPRKRDAVKAITIQKNPRVIEYFTAERATGPNQGRHLDRVVNSENLNMVFESDEGIFYSSSVDNGESWYEESQGDGWFPCIGISHEGFSWIAYVQDGDLICKIRRPDSSYKEIIIFDGNENIWAGPASMVLATMPIKEDVIDYAYITYTVYEGSMPENPMPQPPENISHSYIYVTIFDTTDKVTYLIDEAESETQVSHPCLAVTPADLIHIVWQREDEIWYITNSDKITPENWQYVEWTEKYSLSQTELISEHPFVESYGDMVYVVWKEGNIGEIIQKQRYVWKPSEYENWSEPENISNSAEMNSDYPQMSTSEVIVWQEADAENNYKVYAKIYNDNICLTPDANDIRFVNCNALIIDPKEPEIEVYYCYTDEITENELYQVKFEKYHYDNGFPDEEIEYYEGKIGIETASPYCELRSGYIDYGNYKIDYGNQLKYKLKYLNPYKKYLFKAVLYQCTTSTIRQKLDVEDTLASTDTIYSAQPETVSFFIRPNSYKENLASKIKIHKMQGAYSVLADFKIYEYEIINDSGSGGSGPQSEGLVQLPVQPVLHAPRPNPFTNQTEIRFQIAVKTKVDLKVYNSAGRLVNTLVADEINPGYYTMSWNGKDEIYRTQANGVYFVRLKTKDYDATKKMILVRR